MTPHSPPSRRLTAARSLRVVLVVAAVALAAWLILDARFAGLSDREADSGAPSATRDAASVPPRPADAFALTVLHVFDGDTIEARTIGPNAVEPALGIVRVRLIGVDAPEGTPSSECWADEARERLRALLPEGATVWAASDIEGRDRYDRALLYLWTEDGVFVNHALVANGDADALLVEPNDAHHPLLLQAESSARAASAGQWGACG